MLCRLPVSHVVALAIGAEACFCRFTDRERVWLWNTQGGARHQLCSAGQGLHADLIATDCSSVHFGWGSCRLYALTFQVKVIGCSSRALYVLTFQVKVIGRWTSRRLHLLTFQVKSFRWQLMSLLLCPLLCV